MLSEYPELGCVEGPLPQTENSSQASAVPGSPSFPSSSQCPQHHRTNCARRQGPEMKTTSQLRGLSSHFSLSLSL